MGDKVFLTVEERKILGKKVKQLRKQGYVPGVVYGHNLASTPVMAPANVIEKVWHDAGRHHAVELTVGDKKRLAMIKSADIDPVKHRLRHVSFHVVKQNEKVQTEVPVRIVGEGETEAEKAGLVVLQALESLNVEALPRALPDFMEVPSNTLIEPGDHVSVADIQPIEGVTILTEPEVVVATVYEPSALQAANEAAAGEAEPGDEDEVEAEQGTEESEYEGEDQPAEMKEKGEAKAKE